MCLHIFSAHRLWAPQAQGASTGTGTGKGGSAGTSAERSSYALKLSGAADVRGSSMETQLVRLATARREPSVFQLMLSIDPSTAAESAAYIHLRHTRAGQGEGRTALACVTCPAVKSQMRRIELAPPVAQHLRTLSSNTLVGMAEVRARMHVPVRARACTCAGVRGRMHARERLREGEDGALRCCRMESKRSQCAVRLERSDLCGVR